MDNNKTIGLRGVWEYNPSVNVFLCTCPVSVSLWLFLVSSYGCTVGNKTEFLASADLTEEEFQENPIINWDAILWVNRPVELWGVQLVLALISLTEALLITYLGYKVSTFIYLCECSPTVTQ